MKLLLDTHTFLWFVLNHLNLSETAQTLICDSRNDILLSPASYWEIAIKISLGKYQVPGPYEPWMQQQIIDNEFEILPITVAHTATLTTLPFHHKDPFDRLLVAQAIVEKIPLISADNKLSAYDVNRLW